MRNIRHPWLALENTVQRSGIRAANKIHYLFAHIVTHLKLSRQHIHHADCIFPVRQKAGLCVSSPALNNQ